MRRYLVVGDIHGCAEELRELVGAACAHDAGRQIVAVGDLVAKGPDSRGVVRFLRERGALAVRGNHDQKLIEWQADPARPLGEAHRRAAEQLEGEDLDWLRALPLFLRLEGAGAIVVHGGLVPGAPLEAQAPAHLMNMRSIASDGSASDRVDGGVPWASLWPGPELVLFGHDAIRGLQRHPHAVGLDTGCVYGGQLTGYLLPERRLLQVQAKRVWSEGGG